VLEALQRLDTTNAEESGKGHVHHLRGLALYHQGEYEQAKAEFAAAAATPGGCDVSNWVEWLQALTDASSDAPTEATRLLASVRRADRSLEARDGVRALGELDTWHWHVWNSVDLQIRARLAEGMLLHPGSSSAQLRIRKRLMLAAYLQQFHERPIFRRELPLGPFAWSAERLADVADRARAWLYAGM
jgi:hypothetical protein